jgi:hypothetical protein
MSVLACGVDGQIASELESRTTEDFPLSGRNHLLNVAVNQALIGVVDGVKVGSSSLARFLTSTAERTCANPLNPIAMTVKIQTFTLNVFCGPFVAEMLNAVSC